MGSFGENLRREREMRGVTLQEISAATKISVRFLEAIESEEFSKLPGGVFSRGFIRAYARYLGLDEERVLAEYHLAAQPKPDVDLSRIMTTKPPSKEGPRTLLLAVMVAAVLLGAGYLLFRYSYSAPEQRGDVTNPVPSPSKTQPAAPQQQASTPPGQALGTSGNEPAPASATGPTGSSSAPDAAAARRGRSSALPVSPKPAGDNELVLQVAATERAWVAVDADGKTTLQRILNPNEVETLKAKESFNVITGNAQGIILTLNGETLKPLGRHGEVKTIRLTHDDLKNSTP